VADEGYTVEERQHRVVRETWASLEERIQCPHIAMNGLAKYPGLA
jgi:hypothetical protein